ncbi:MAG: hypothetical protein ABIH41_05005 [Nanoarchaeota archaeon]
MPPTMDEATFWTDIGDALSARGRVVDMRGSTLPQYLGAGILAANEGHQVAFGRFRHFSLDAVLREGLLSLDPSFYAAIVDRVSSPQMLEHLRGVDAVVLDFKPSVTAPHNVMYRLWGEGRDETALVLDMDYVLHLSADQLGRGVREMRVSLDDQYRSCAKESDDAKIPAYWDPSVDVKFVSSRTPSMAALRNLILERSLVLRFQYNADPLIVEKEKRFLDLQKRVIELTDAQGTQEAMFGIAQMIFGHHGQEMVPFFRDTAQTLLTSAPRGDDLEDVLAEDVIGQDVVRAFGVEERVVNSYYARRGINDLLLVRYPEGRPKDAVVRLNSVDVPIVFRQQILDSALKMYGILDDAVLFQRIRGAQDEYIWFRQRLEHVIAQLDPARLPEDKVVYGALRIAQGDIAVWTPHGKVLDEAREGKHLRWGVPPGGELDYGAVQALERMPDNDYLEYYGLKRDDYQYVSGQRVVFFDVNGEQGAVRSIRARPHIRQSVLDQGIPDGARAVFLNQVENFCGMGYLRCLEPVATVSE